MKFIKLSNGYDIRVDEISHMFESPSASYASLEVTMKCGKILTIEHKYKAVFREQFKELTK